LNFPLSISATIFKSHRGSAYSKNRKADCLSYFEGAIRVQCAGDYWHVGQHPAKSGRPR
jgi:hypothetical protein